MKKYLTIVFSLTVCLFFSLPASGQRFSVSTNAVEWANLATINAEAGFAVGQHFSVHAGARVNPWTWRASSPDDRYTDPTGDEEKQFQNKKQSYNIGVRYWPWYVYSGWWAYARAQYSEYDYGGFITHPREAGDAVGLGIGGGYTYMLSHNWNIEFGVGVWGGYKSYGKYRCTNCGQPVEKGQKIFFMPDDVMVSLIYIF